MAGLYNGHVLEFPTIRIDSFTSPGPSGPFLLPDPTDPLARPAPAPNAQLYLLTHVHADHLVGLTSAFTGKIVCAGQTKRMLLRLEAEVERKLYLQGRTEASRRRYEGLQARTVGDKEKGKERVVDLIEAVPYNCPMQYEVGYENGKPVVVTITVLDANHCPGSTMFLIEGQGKAVLHTGDLRADGLFLQTLRRNTALSAYFAPWPGVPVAPGSKRRKLDRIYFDNGAMLGTGDMPDKEEALMEMIGLMNVYPPNTVFFLNVWCFGWEDVVKEVARHFGVPVHVDPYKHSIYKAIQTDHALLSLTTLDPHATRFHACERLAKCAACRTYDAETNSRRWNLDKRVVSVNMVEVKTAAWEVEKREFVDRLNAAALGEGEWPYSIGVPIARHSTLPELQRFVALFRPAALSVTTFTHPEGRDYYHVPDFFGDCMDDVDAARLCRERDVFFERHPRFGPQYLRAMEAQAVQKRGALAVGAAHGTSRKAFANDHMARMAGATPAADYQTALNAYIAAQYDASDAYLARREDGDDWFDYDTDEEENEARRKRRAGARVPKPTQVKVESCANGDKEPASSVLHRSLSRDAIDAKTHVAIGAAHIDELPQGSRDMGKTFAVLAPPNGADHLGSVKTELIEPPPAQPEPSDDSAPPCRPFKRGRTSRFSVDRAHLAALVHVKVEKET
ncbi:hypothetical protein Q5752_006437 [Cryptotrichosporon argae]